MDAGGPRFIAKIMGEEIGPVQGTQSCRGDAGFGQDLFANDEPVAGLTNATNTCLYLTPPAGQPPYATGQRCLAVVRDRGREIGANLNYRF